VAVLFWLTDFETEVACDSAGFHCCDKKLIICYQVNVCVMVNRKTVFSIYCCNREKIIFVSSSSSLERV